MSKITEKIGKEIISKYNEGIKVRHLVKEYNISQQTINRYLKCQNINVQNVLTNIRENIIS